MDPQAAWTEMLAALSQRDWPAALAAAEALADWLRRGGFAPQALAELPQDHPLQRVIALTVCDQVLQMTGDAPADG